jgi:AraC-like DNA-binding protein
VLTPRLLSSVEFEIIAVERNRPGKWWRFQNVSNPYSRLYLVTKGEAHVRHHGRRSCLGPDSLHVIPAFTRTDLYCEDYFEVQYVHFTSRLSGGPDLFSILDCHYQADATPREHELFTRLLELNPDAGLRDYDPHKTVAETQAKRDSRLTGGPDVARYLETDGLVRQLLAPILRTATDRSVSRLAGIGRFEEVLAYMNEHLDEPLTLESLAARAHLNPTYFSDLFSETLGLRPIDYLNRRRVERAQMMLLTTSLTVKQIAARVGFTGSAYFCRVFKKYCGHTPSAYRATGGAVI